MKEDMPACGCQPEGSLIESDINNTASLKGSFLPVGLSEEGFEPALPLVSTQTAALPALTKTTFTHSRRGNE